MNDSTTALIPADAPRIETIRDALEEEARMVAVEIVVKARKAKVREWLDAEANAQEARTGTTFTSKLKGLGTAYRDEPSERIVVHDEAEWFAWCLDNDLATVKLRVNAAALEREIENGTDVGKRLAAVLDEIDNAVRPDTIVAADTVETIAAECDRREIDGEVYLVTKDAEILPLRVETSRAPRLTVKVDPALKAKLAAEIEARLTPIAILPSPEEADRGSE